MARLAGQFRALNLVGPAAVVILLLSGECSDAILTSVDEAEVLHQDNTAFVRPQRQG